MSLIYDEFFNNIFLSAHRHTYVHSEKLFSFLMVAENYNNIVFSNAIPGLLLSKTYTHTHVYIQIYFIVSKVHFFCIKNSFIVWTCTYLTRYLNRDRKKITNNEHAYLDIMRVCGLLYDKTTIILVEHEQMYKGKCIIVGHFFIFYYYDFFMWLLLLLVSVYEYIPDHTKPFT